jgi:hypothetical protein
MDAFSDCVHKHQWEHEVPPKREQEDNEMAQTMAQYIAQQVEIEEVTDG